MAVLPSVVVIVAVVLVVAFVLVHVFLVLWVCDVVANVINDVLVLECTFDLVVLRNT